MLLRFLVRDLVIVGLAAGLWFLLAERSGGTGFVADLSGWIVGLLLGATAYLAHEWSHFLGGWAMGSKMTIGTNIGSGFMFSFDADENSLRQFVVMSLAGFVATGMAVAFFYLGLPDDLLASRIARGGSIFLTLLGVTLEVPLLLYGIITQGVPKQVSI